MDKTKEMLTKVGLYSKKHWFVFLAIFVYLFFSIYYVGLAQSVTDCNNAINGLGDNTAGPIWREANTNNPPVGGFSSVTNYPVGDQLSSPIDAVVVGQSVLLWTTAKMFGPVCGYNITNVLGFVSAALVMCGFVYSLTKGRRWLALLAGYAVAFTPFFQAKMGGHPSYGFQAVLIGIVWAFYSYVTTRKKSRAVALVLLTAFCFYFDPYFSLLSMTILGPTVLAWLIVRYLQSARERADRKKFIDQIKNMAVFAAFLAVLIAPIAYIMVSQASQINSATAGTRDDIIRTAKVYSNMPSEYLLPYKDSFLLNFFGSYKQQVVNSWYAFSNGNVSEDSVGISLLMLAVIALFFIIAGWEKLQKKRLNLNKVLAYNPKLIVFSALGFVVLAILLALPPVHLMGVPLPSYVLLKLTTTWRVLSREYVVVNIGVTILFIVSLIYFVRALKIKPVIQAVLYGLCFMFIFVQYQTYRPFEGARTSEFNYKNAPAGYMWLKNQNDIKAVAEYPIEKATESNSHGYYLSMQMVHKKPLLNSALNDSPQDTLRAALKNLSDPQTVPTLHALGIDAILVHGVDPQDITKIPGLTVVYSGQHGTDAGLPGSTAVTKDVFVVARISSTVPKPVTSIQIMTTPMLDGTIQTSSVTWQYELPSGAKLGLRRLPNEPGGVVSDKICFAARMAVKGESADLLVKQGDTVISTLPLTDQYQTVSFAANTDQTFSLVSSNKHLLQLTQLGCSE